MFYFPLNSLLGFEGDEEKFVRGITAMRDSFAVGCSTGNILIFSSKDGGNFPLVHNLESERVPVTCLASSSSLLVSANDNGKLFGYSINDAFEQTFSFPGQGSPCTTLCMRESLLLAGYASGHIRAFRTDIVEMAFEISAHTRAVTGLSLNYLNWGERGVERGSELASCSQDQILHVWALPDFRSNASCRASLLYSGVLENKMCTGVAFLSGERVCVSSYDEDEIMMFRKIK